MPSVATRRSTSYVVMPRDGNSPSRLVHASDRFIGRQHCMREKSVVDDRGLIAVAPYRMARPSRCVFDYGNLEALLEKLAQMGLDAHIPQHATEDDLAHPSLAQLQNQIVGLRPEHLVGAYDDGLSVFDIPLEAIEPVRARVRETGQRERAFSCKSVGPELIGLERSVHLPTVVGWIEIMGRDEYFIAASLRSLEDSLHILDCAVLGNARADRSPICPLLAQHIVLRVNKHHCGIGFLDIHGFCSILHSTADFVVVKLRALQ